MNDKNIVTTFQGDEANISSEIEKFLQVAKSDIGKFFVTSPLSELEHANRFNTTPDVIRSLHYNAPTERKLCRNGRDFAEYYYILRESTLETIELARKAAPEIIDPHGDLANFRCGNSGEIQL